MRGHFLAFVLAVVAVGCSQPRSREFFQMRENAEYGDTYSFSLDLCDSTVTYSMDFFTRFAQRIFALQLTVFIHIPRGTAARTEDFTSF